jgi:hypothetical protein
MTSSTLRRYLRMYMYALELVFAIPLSLPFIALGWLARLVDRYAETSVLISHVPVLPR